MTEISNIGGSPRLVQTFGADFTQVPSIVANPSAGLANGVVVFAELDQIRQTLETAYKSADANDTAAWTSAVNNVVTQLNSFNQQINAALQEVKYRTAVASRITDLAQASAPIPGLVSGLTPDDYQGHFLVDNAATPAQNGIYYLDAKGNPTRVASYANASDFPAGLLIYVNSGTFHNSLWLVRDKAMPVSAASAAVGSVSFIPFQSATDLKTAASSFLTFVAGELNASLNNDYFAVSNGALTLSTTFLNRVTAAEGNIVGLQGNVTTLQTQVTSINSLTTQMQPVLQRVLSSVDALSKSDATQNASIATLNDRLAKDEANIASSQTAITSQSTAISAIGDRLTKDEANIATLTLADAAQESALASLQIDVAARQTANQVQEAMKSWYRACAIRKVLVGGVSTIVNGFTQTVFTMDLSSELATLGAGASYRRVSFNEAAAPYEQIQEPDVCFPGQSVQVTMFSKDHQVADNSVVIYMSAFFEGDNSGSGYGNGYGSGNGNGYGNGYGSGYGYGYGK